MTDIEFHSLLSDSTNMAMEFAKRYLIDDLPKSVKYSVNLNFSTDDKSLIHFDLYPGDNDKIVEFITDKDVIMLLLRKGKVPVWIDISVNRIYADYTLLRLLCAGRYSADENEFYYTKNKTGPFGIKSPVFPIDYIEGTKFRLLQ